LGLPVSTKVNRSHSFSLKFWAAVGLLSERNLAPDEMKWYVPAAPGGQGARENITDFLGNCFVMEGS
jgi:hypothetical protein